MSSHRLVHFGLMMLVVFTFMLTIGIGEEFSSTAAAPIKGTCGSSTGAIWDQNLSGTCRFTVLVDFQNQAVRDNNTGLVWEQTPSTATFSWFNASTHCWQRTIANTKGWRLPSMAELLSVMDPSLPIPFVPATVFNVSGLPLALWSGTTYSDINETVAWALYNTLPATPLLVAGTIKTEVAAGAWCVRGPVPE
jgi:uncharacterized protein DUF1566